MDSASVDPIAAARTPAADRLASIAQSAIGCGANANISTNAGSTDEANADEADLHDAAKLYALLAHMRLLGRTVAAAVGVGAAVTSTADEADAADAGSSAEGDAHPPATQASMITAVRNRMRPFNMRPAAASTAAALMPSHLDRSDEDWNVTHDHAAPEGVMASPHSAYHGDHGEYHSPNSSASASSPVTHEYQRTPHSPFGSPQSSSSSAHESRQQRPPRSSPLRAASPSAASATAAAPSVVLSPFPFAANARPASGVKGFDEADWDALHSTDKQATAHERQVWSTLGLDKSFDLRHVIRFCSRVEPSFQITLS
jgi:arsenate reductase-like glutaredoxin family protein